MAEPANDPKPSNDDAFEALRKRREDEKASRQMFQISGIGFEFAVSVGGFAVLGWWLDRKFEASPIWTLTGVAVGFAWGLYRLVTFAKRRL